METFYGCRDSDSETVQNKCAIVWVTALRQLVLWKHFSLTQQLHKTHTHTHSLTLFIQLPLCTTTDFCLLHPEPLPLCKEGPAMIVVLNPLVSFSIFHLRGEEQRTHTSAYQLLSVHSNQTSARSLWNSNSLFCETQWKRFILKAPHWCF